MSKRTPGETNGVLLAQLQRLANLLSAPEPDKVKIGQKWSTITRLTHNVDAAYAALGGLKRVRRSDPDYVAKLNEVLHPEPDKAEATATVAA